MAGRQRTVSRKRTVENCGTAIRRSRWQAERAIETLASGRRVRRGIVSPDDDLQQIRRTQREGKLAGAREHGLART